MPRPVTLSIELLTTFVSLLRNECDPVRTAEQLGINHASLSKRLRYLQHGGRPLPRPWLVREGHRWRLTEEGQRVHPAVEEIVRRYERLTEFVDGSQRPEVRFACGQHAILGFVKIAIEQFRNERPESRLRISTMRGAARIEGVANGLLDLATVTHDDSDILVIARRPLHIEPILTDRFVLISADDAEWSRRFSRLPKTKASAGALADFPLILPEPDAGIRKSLDRAFRDAEVLAELDIVLEIGGWAAMLSYVRAGLGISVISEAAVQDRSGLIVRYLNPQRFPPQNTRLISRRLFGTSDVLDLSTEAWVLRDALKQAAKSWRRRDRL